MKNICSTSGSGGGARGHMCSSVCTVQAQYPEVRSVLSEPQRALVSTISAGQEAIDSAQSLLTEKAKLPPLGTDPASVR